MRSDLQLSREKALFILVIEHLSGANNYQPVAELNERYHAKIPEHLLLDAFSHWQKEGLAKTYRAGTPLSARLRRDACGDAYEMVLASLGATSLKVAADLREIYTDADAMDDVPLPDGWKWFTFAKENPKPMSEPSQSSMPVSIVSNFSPVNSVHTASPSSHFGGISWAGWLGALVGVAGIVVTLWIAGKL